MPLQRRLPKRGFTPRNRIEYATINVVDLDFFDDGAVVTPQEMFEAGLLRKPSALVKILGDGDLDKKLTVSAHKFSASAIEKISAKGGTTEVIGGE